MRPPIKSSSIRDKFGIDYLSSGSASQSAAADPDTERLLTAYGNRILSSLDQSADKSGRVYEILDQQSGLKIETLLKLIDKMISLDLLQIEVQDKYANHKIGITPTGEKLLQH